MAKAKGSPEPKALKRKTASQTPKEPKLSKNIRETEIPFKTAPFCSFCGKPGNYLTPLIAGPHNIYICVNCVEVCIAILLSDEVDNKGTNWRQRVNEVLDNPNKFQIEIGKKKRKKGNS
ncbi:MAG: hypothetical protein LBH43_02335 [Treponema sp.]|jgi:hypothetical protein|nr:hypothetical protein [Treponema sp.]